VALYTLGAMANKEGIFGGAERPTEDGRPPVTDAAGSGGGRSPAVFLSCFFHLPSVGNFYQLRDSFILFFHMRFSLSWRDE
jgi:hypothetical protein